MKRMLIAPVAALFLLASPASANQSGDGGGFRQEGQGSFFRSGQGDNTVTASGQPVDPQGMTAAHRTLPLGTKATVTNQDSGQSVEVVINDRGPSREDRVIDVSEAAAERLGMETLGVVPVIVEVDPAKQDDPEVRKQVEELAASD